MAVVEPQEVLRQYLNNQGMKASRQREIIVEVFFREGGHLSVEDLLDKARQIDTKISLATVYRTMKLLTDCGLAAAHNFMTGQTRYERSSAREQHHDHMICLSCHIIVEFVNKQIEDLQEQVARKHHFVVHHHKMELYGLCHDCWQKQAALPPP